MHVNGSLGTRISLRLLSFFSLSFLLLSVKRKQKMDPNKQRFPSGLPGSPYAPVARGRGFLREERALGRARGLGVTPDEPPVGQARGLAVASEEPPVGRARGLALIADEPSISRARGQSVTAEQPSVGRARGLPVAPREPIAGRGRGLALDTPLFPYARGSPGLGLDTPVGIGRGTQQEEDAGVGFGRARGILHSPVEPAVGKGRSVALFMKEPESPGKSERVETPEQEPPKVQASIKVKVGCFH